MQIAAKKLAGAVVDGGQSDYGWGEQWRVFTHHQPREEYDESRFDNVPFSHAQRETVCELLHTDG
jgi:O-acetylhomoserine/O-acetylserine sulfhydrylase-like pyridoxal-dependent enzyme